MTIISTTRLDQFDTDTLGNAAKEHSGSLIPPTIALGRRSQEWYLFAGGKVLTDGTNILRFTSWQDAGLAFIGVGWINFVIQARPPIND